MGNTFTYFGTDGIRGKVGSYPITIDFALKLGWALGQVIRVGDKRPKVVIGKDTRISGYMFESALQAGLIASGCDILLTGPLATPAIAYLTRTFKADAGIVISASHNAYTDNGIKIFSSNGLKIDDFTQARIEKKIADKLDCVPANKLGRAIRVNDAVGRYVEFCKSVFPKSLSLKNFRIVVDCANGATYQAAPMVFRELGAEVFTIGDEPDGFNINATCGSTFPQATIDAVKTYRANLGVVLDGDGDRVIMIDSKGCEFNGDDLLYILTSHMQNNGSLRGVIGTHMTNLAYELFCQDQEIGFARVDVGDRNIIRELTERGWNLGAEPSGHIILSDYSTTGDGVIASLMVMVALVSNNLDLHQMLRNFHQYPQVLINLTYQPHQHSVIDKAIAQIQQSVQHQSTTDTCRVLLRKSGTEPLVRIMVESADEQLAKQKATQLQDQLQQSIAKLATRNR